MLGAVLLAVSASLMRLRHVQSRGLAAMIRSGSRSSPSPCRPPPTPCITLPEGWGSSGFDPSQRGTSFLLISDRSPGRPVVVRLAATCQPGKASPSRRGPGVVTYTRLTSIAPRFAGSLYDVFPGGCVSYGFDFTLGHRSR
jgi:hypothetical protein